MEKAVAIYKLSLPLELVNIIKDYAFYDITTMKYARMLATRNAVWLQDIKNMNDIEPGYDSDYWEEYRIEMSFIAHDTWY